MTYMAVARLSGVAGRFSGKLGNIVFGRWATWALSRPLRYRTLLTPLRNQNRNASSCGLEEGEFDMPDLDVP